MSKQVQGIRAGMHSVTPRLVSEAEMHRAMRGMARSAS
jgi:hypothetical protein